MFTQKIHVSMKRKQSAIGTDFVKMMFTWLKKQDWYKVCEVNKRKVFVKKQTNNRRSAFDRCFSHHVVCKTTSLRSNVSPPTGTAFLLWCMTYLITLRSRIYNLYCSPPPGRYQDFGFTCGSSYVAHLYSNSYLLHQNNTTSKPSL